MNIRKEFQHILNNNLTESAPQRILPLGYVLTNRIFPLLEFLSIPSTNILIRDAQLLAGLWEKLIKSDKDQGLHSVLFKFLRQNEGTVHSAKKVRIKTWGVSGRLQ